MDVAEEELQDLYVWVDDIPLSRPKRNIARDFSDGVLLAEVLYHYFPRDVHLHNYSAANGHTQKMYNWHTLNSKVCSRLGFVIPNQACDDAVRAKPGAIERVLKLLRTKIADLAGEEDTQHSQQTKDASQSAPLQQQHVHERGHDNAHEHAETAPLASSKHSKSRGVSDATAATDVTTAQARAHHTSPQTTASTRPQRVSGGSSSGAAGALQRRTSSLQHAHSAAAVESSRADELQEMVKILETKSRKLEQLMRLKDAKIEALSAKLEAAGLEA